VPVTYHIVALGPPGAGKTIYLAAIHHMLSGHAEVFGGNISATVVDSSGRAFLKRVYDQAADPEALWPEGTRSGEAMREFTFRFSVSWTQRGLRGRTKLHSYEVLRISYVDYAGEWIPDADQVSQALMDSFNQRVADAHAMLGVIDGVKLLQFLDGHPTGDRFLHDHLGPVVDFMQGVKIPIHFVVTKWDLFDGRYTLAEVCDRLLDTRRTGLRHLVASRTSYGRLGRGQGTVRLIPVSSLGKVATLDEHWQVHKMPGAEASPINVEIPLAAVVHDVLELKRRELDAQAVAPGRPSDPASPEVQISPSGVNISVTQVVANILAQGGKVAKTLGRPAVHIGRSMRSSVRKVRAKGITGVTSQEAALFYVMQQMGQRLRQFEESEPSALLTAKDGQR
jgi:hypothetical protein